MDLAPSYVGYQTGITDEQLLACLRSLKVYRKEVWLHLLIDLFQEDPVADFSHRAQREEVRRRVELYVHSWAKELEYKRTVADTYRDPSDADRIRYYVPQCLTQPRRSANGRGVTYWQPTGLEVAGDSLILDAKPSKKRYQRDLYFLQRLCISYAHCRHLVLCYLIGELVPDDIAQVIKLNLLYGSLASKFQLL